MDQELLLNASDSDLFDDDQLTFEASESSSPNIQPRQQPRLRSAIHIPRRSRPSSSDNSSVVGPSPSSSSRGRPSLRRLRDILPHRNPSPSRARSKRSDESLRHRNPPRQHSDGPPASDISEWTVARLKNALSQRNIHFHRSDKKTKLFQLFTDSQRNTALPLRASRALPGSQRRGASHGRSPASALPQGQVVSNPGQALSFSELSHPSSILPQTAQPTRAHAPFHPSIPSSSQASTFPIPPSLATPAPPTSIPAQTAPTTAIIGGAFGQNPFFPPVSSFLPPFPYPYPLPTYNPYVASVTHSTSNAPLFSTAPPTASSSAFFNYPPPPTSFTLATALPPVRPVISARPSPVSTTLRQQILTGNYVDLAQLIHPSTCNPHIPRELQTPLGPIELKQPLPTRSKELTVVEFAFTFSLYRDTICSVFPDRRSELDDYLSLILDLALRFGGNGFYTYHTLFASQAAGRLQQYNQGTYWGILDPELYCRVFAARASLNCDLCSAPSHPATACSLTASQPRASAPYKRNPAVSSLPPAAPPPSITPKPAIAQPNRLGPLPKGVDKRGRPVLYQGGRMVCNNFNDLGCNASSCRFLHTCSFCGGAHTRPTCPHNPTQHSLCKYLNTPIKINALASALKNHPDRPFVNFLIQGFTHGFHPGLQVTPDSSYTCHNLQSAITEPDIADKLLEKEIKEAFMIGPFSSPPFPIFRISPIGIATRKYSGKKRLIVDLSSPHGTTTPSINSLIPSPDFSMQYATIDHAISLIRLAGQGAWLAKADITSAFKVLPIHPDYWHVFGVLWKGAYYFCHSLPFPYLCITSPP